jgi:hypothetical protein
MRLVRPLLIIVLVLATASGLLLWLVQKYPDHSTTIAVLERTNIVNQESLAEFTESASLELQTLAERAQEVGGHAQNVLGSAIQRSDDGSLQNPLENAVQPSTDQAPLHERALEYGRYLYCQEVVKSYEVKYQD